MKQNHQEVVKKISQTVRLKRNSLGLSQEELADLVEIDRTYASQIERGVANPSLKVLCKLADVLEISLSQLLGETELD